MTTIQKKITKNETSGISESSFQSSRITEKPNFEPINFKNHKKILERYLPIDREVDDLDMFAISRLPISLEQKISMAKDFWAKSE